VGVSRQYAGIIGKVDNCQVSVHASLSNEKFCALVGTALFLPESWADNPERCEEAGIPAAEQVHMTKPSLALKQFYVLISIKMNWSFCANLF
jgi:SRSO17 transposase